MIASMIAKRKLRSVFLMMNEDDFDVDKFLAICHDDLIWDSHLEFGVGETIEGKKTIADWFRRWNEEFPKRKIEVKDICFSRWAFCLKNVATVQWTLTETDKQGKTFKFDGVTAGYFRNFKCIRISDFISFVGLPKLSDLMAPLVES